MNTQEIFPPSNKLWVSNLHSSVQRGDLENTFGRFGEVTRVYIDARRFGFVVFNAVESAKTALQSLQGQPLHGPPMLIQFAKPDKVAGQHRIESHSNILPPPPPPPPLLPHQQRPHQNPVVPHPVAVGGPSVRPAIAGSVGPAWTGVIAKGGVPVCQARCDPILPPWIDAANIPPVLNLSEKATLESLRRYLLNGSGTIGYSISIFLPEPEANVSPYTELLAYFTQKGVAGVAKLNDGASLYLVPYPSAFLSDGPVLSVRPEERRLYGVAMRFPPPETLTSGLRVVSRDPRRRPENVIRRSNKNPPSSSVGVLQIAAASMPQPPSSSGSGVQWPYAEAVHHRRDDSADAGEQMMTVAGPDDNDRVLKQPMMMRRDEMYDPEDWEPLVVEGSSSDRGMKNDGNDDYVVGTSYPPRKRFKKYL